MKSIVIDVDRVIAVAEDLSIPYYEREVYPCAVEALRKLKEAGFFIRIQTARGMDRFDGDLPKIINYHERQLRDWLLRNQVPFDEVYFGKAVTNTFYVDDLAFNVQSENGKQDWDRLMVALGVS